ncbi:MAG: hypothetical protein KDA44_15400, partial [Planctomycetales bacterium]|nr:hypothetical protein [Planctomycetales bacterium]
MAREHYWRTTDEDFARAVSSDAGEAAGKALPPALLSTPVSGSNQGNRDAATAENTPKNAEKTLLSSALANEASSPGGTRTPDQGIMSPLL